MTDRAKYSPGPAAGAGIQKDGDHWTLTLVRELRHSPETVWKAITDPEHLRQWAPFDADRNLGTVGTTWLTTVGAPTPIASEGRVVRAEAPKVLELNWGGQDLRFELEPLDGGGTRLALWHNIDRRYIAMGAAGWHVCLDVMERLISGHPIGRIVGLDAMQSDGWQRLHAEYARQFAIDAPGAQS